MTTPTVETVPPADATLATADRSNTQPPTRWWASLAGLLGAGFALAFGELVAALNTSIVSLVTAVGDVVIELTPGTAVATSINTLGSYQKPLLVIGITVVALAIGARIGRSGATRPAVVPLAYLAFGIVGGVASARSDLSSAFGSWVVALVAAAAGAAITLGLLRAARRPDHARPSPAVTVDPARTQLIVPGSPLSQAADRRRFLAFGGAAVGTAAVFAGSRVLGTSVAERARDEILAAGSAPADLPSGVDAPAAWSATPGEFDGVDGISRFITPISPDDEFYVIDTAISKPQVDPATWSLTIDGYVDNEVTYTYDQLMARDMIEREVTLSCVSNPIGGSLVDNAHWRGIALTELFEEAGVDGADLNTQIFMRSVDGFTCGFPTHLAYDGRTAMLALEMNGEPLPIIHGFPARVVVAGLYGYVSATKWIETISITDWEGVDGFWMPRGWSKEGPIKTQSRIDVPQHGQTVDTGRVVLGGVAWAPGTGVARVEVAIGNEENWTEADLAEVDTDETWRQWRYEWAAPPGVHTIRVRATDKRGVTQSPVPVAPAPNGAEGHHAIQVRVV